MQKESSRMSHQKQNTSSETSKPRSKKCRGIFPRGCKKFDSEVAALFTHIRHAVGGGTGSTNASLHCFRMRIHLRWIYMGILAVKYRMQKMSMWITFNTFL